MTSQPVVQTLFMHRISLVLACFACAGHGQHTHISLAELQSRARTDWLRSSGQASADSNCSPTDILAMLLVSCNPAAAFNPSALEGSHLRGLQMRGCGGMSRPHWHRSRLPYAQSGDADDISAEEVAKAREALLRQFGGGPAPGPAGPEVQRVDRLGPGLVLAANPEMFKSQGFFQGAKIKDLNRFGLRGPLDSNMLLSSARVAQMLPVLLLTEYEPDGVTRALLLERRSGALMGDLPFEGFGCVAISPIWVGGFENSNKLTIVHDVPDLEGATELGEGLFTGGWQSAAPLVSNSSLAESHFKFFVGRTEWEPGQLEQEVKDGAWFVLQVEAAAIVKERLSGWRAGQPKPVWTELMQQVKDDWQVEEALSKFYDELDPDDDY